MNRNFILMTDSYKLTHWSQYPSDTVTIYSYLESRGGKYPKTLFFGLQYFLKEYFNGKVITRESIDEAESFSLKHFGKKLFNKEGWEYILTEYDGRLPLEIKAVKEGSVIPVSNVLLTIKNTDHKCPWLTNVVETIILRMWYPITVSTNSFYSKVLIRNFMNETNNGDLTNLSFKLHDFGARGVSSEETAMIGGAAHLVNFMGTDTITGIRMTMNYYDADVNGFSVSASEHSVACAFGKDNEREYFLNMLNKYPDSPVSIVADTNNVYNFVDTMTTEFYDKIKERTAPIIFRPDSGDPLEVNSKLIDILWNKFGGSINNGYKTLIPQVRLIQGGWNRL